MSLGRAVQIKPLKSNYRLELAVALKLLGELDRASTELDLISKGREDSTELLLERADVAKRRGDDEAAVNALEVVAKRHPERATTLRELGDRLARLGRWSEVIGWLNLALQGRA